MNLPSWLGPVSSLIGIVRAGIDVARQIFKEKENSFLVRVEKSLEGSIKSVEKFLRGNVKINFQYDQIRKPFTQSIHWNTFSRKARRR